MKDYYWIYWQKIPINIPGHIEDFYGVLFLSGMNFTDLNEYSFWNSF